MQKRMKFADELAPLPICSLGSHLINLVQSKKPFYLERGMPSKLNISLCLVSPSGLSKSWVIKCFLSPKYGISPVPVKTGGKITEAGFVGTISKHGELVLGDAYEMKEGILAFNELSNVFLTSRSNHSAELLNQVLECLSEGRVSKKLGTQSIAYDTNLTLWGGLQYGRLSTASGLKRRFLFVAKKWKPEDIEALKRARISEHIAPTTEESNEIKEELKELLNIQLKDIVFEDSLYERILKKAEDHLQVAKIERALIGKEFINKNIEKNELIIPDSEENEKILEQIIEYEKVVSTGGSYSLLLGILNTRGKTLSELWDAFRKFQYSYEEFYQVLQDAMKMGIVTRQWISNGTCIYKIRKEK